MDPAESDIGTELAESAVILEEGIQEHLWTEGVVDPQAHQVGGKGTLGQLDVISLEVEVGGKPVPHLKSSGEENRFLFAVEKISGGELRIHGNRFAFVREIPKEKF